MALRSRSVRPRGLRSLEFLLGLLALGRPLGHIETEQSGATFPIRVVPMSDETVIEAGRRVYRAGVYVSLVFFPIVVPQEAAR